MSGSDYSGRELIGEGGLGRVFRATRVSTGGPVAIKELREVASASPAWTRAQRELDVMLRLKGHPGVTSVEEIIDGPNGPCIVMEYLAGGSLIDRLGRGALATAEVVLVGRQTSDALRAAHELGIVHRDIKPHNLLVSAFGHVKVCDFGISALVRDAGGRTRTNALTLAYASPEELDEADNIGPSADVYSLAATLQHLLTGQKPSFRNRATELDALRDRAAAAEPGERMVLETLVAGQIHEPTARPTMAQMLDVFDRADAALGDSRISHLVVSPESLNRSIVAPQLREALSTHRPPPPPPGWSDTRRVPPRVVAPQRTVAAAISPAAPDPAVPVRRRRHLGRLLAVVLVALVATGAVVLAPRLTRNNDAATEDPTVQEATSLDASERRAGAAATDVNPATVTVEPSTTPASIANATAVPTTALTTLAPATVAVAVRPEAAQAELDRLIALDRTFVNTNLLGSYVVQVAGKTIGVVDQQDLVVYDAAMLLAKYDELTARFGRVVIIRQDEYNHSTVNPNLYQFLITVPFNSKAEGNDWCRANGLAVPDHCFARDRLRQT